VGVAATVGVLATGAADGADASGDPEVIATTDGVGPAASRGPQPVAKAMIRTIAGGTLIQSSV
jgi:hypothetical protein